MSWGPTSPSVVLLLPYRCIRPSAYLASRAGLGVGLLPGLRTEARLCPVRGNGWGPPVENGGTRRRCINAASAAEICDTNAFANAHLVSLQFLSGLTGLYKASGQRSCLPRHAESQQPQAVRPPARLVQHRGAKDDRRDARVAAAG